MFDSVLIPDTHFDWEASLELMGHKESVARDLALMLRDSLPEFNAQLKTALEQKDYKAVQAIAHKLHGGLCYIDTPRLKYLIGHLETACKEHSETIQDIAKFIPSSIDALHETLNTLLK